VTENAELAATRSVAVPAAVVGLVAAVLLGGGAMVLRSESKTNKVALSSSPKPVTVVLATAAKYRPTRLYIGTLQPWVSASIGPQLVSAYIDTVLVRPGAAVKKHEVLATLDCKSASAGSQAVAAQARALDARLKALADESARYKGLLDGGFVAANEVEQRSAATSAQGAEVNAAKAKLLGTTLEVNDCVLRAPFDGEVSSRTMDPGAFVRPGTPIVSVVDRSTVRLSGDAPEVDFGVVAPGTEVKVHILSTGLDVAARISRRAPAADPTTRTVHFEIDLADPSRSIPVGTTGEIRIEVGEPVAATQIPLSAASVRNGKAVVFVVEGDVAMSKTLKVIGESGGSLFVDTSVAAGSPVVSEGRALLTNGDKVAAKTAEASK
jgi:RND family efflux transporter MFP subunit